MKSKPQQKRKTLQILTCDQCNREFSSRGSLNQHMQLHTGQFRHHCLICRKGFNSTSHYKLHMRSHEGVKYHCDYCAKPFVNKQSYLYHLSVHTGQYRFKCDVCDKGFNERRELNKHVTSHPWSKQQSFWKSSLKLVFKNWRLFQLKYWKLFYFYGDVLSFNTAFNTDNNYLICMKR